MHSNLLYDVSAPKKAVNLSANSDLIRAAKEEEINLSDTFEEAVQVKLRSIREQSWREENKAGIEAYNERIEQCGVFAAKHRRF